MLFINHPAVNNDDNKLGRLNDAARRTVIRKLAIAETRIEELEKELKKAKESSSSSNSDSNSMSRKTASINHEIMRRRISNQIKEMWFLVSASYSKLSKTIPDTAQSGFKDMLQNFGDLQRITEYNFDEFVSMDGQQKARDQLAETLSGIVQKRLHRLQNPKNCETARKLVCSLTKGCGYGCQMHHVLYCFMAAYATKRTLVIDSKGWRYSSKGWNAYFRPVSSTCQHSGNPVEWSSDHDKHLEVGFSFKLKTNSHS